MYKRMLRSVLAAAFVAALGFGVLGGTEISWDSAVASAHGEISWDSAVASAHGEISWDSTPAFLPGEISWDLAPTRVGA